jgi:hypothetical protein
MCGLLFRRILYWNEFGYPPLFEVKHTPNETFPEPVSYARYWHEYLEPGVGPRSHLQSLYLWMETAGFEFVDKENPIEVRPDGFVPDIMTLTSAGLFANELKH